MSCTNSTVDLIQSVLAEEIAALGGSIDDCFVASPRLIARGVLPETLDVLPGDSMKGGVAVRADDCDIWVHPYVFRKVCTNGAVIARSGESKLIVISEISPFELESGLRAAIQSCVSRDAFVNALNAMRTPAMLRADIALMMLPFMAQLKAHATPAAVGTIFQRFAESENRSGFDLMNAVTSVARDTTDPEQKWRLEELGGSVPALIGLHKPIQPTHASAACDRTDDELTLV